MDYLINLVKWIVFSFLELLYELYDEFIECMKVSQNRQVAIATTLILMTLGILAVYSVSGNPNVSSYRFTWVYQNEELVSVRTSRVKEDDVLAFVYSCGGCGVDERFIGYLRRDDKIKRVDDINWVRVNSPAGIRLHREVIKRCDTLKSCNP